MPATMKGPAIFLAQFAGDAAPFNSFDAICGWAAGLGYKGVQIPTWDGRLFDLEKAASSDAYCEEVKGTVGRHGLAVTELSSHLQGQLVAVHPAYDEGFDTFAPAKVHGNPKARQEWATEQVRLAAQASRRLGLTSHVTFSGALAYPYLYPWPPRPKGLIDTAFDELARRWRPLLDAFDEAGVDVGYELHPARTCWTGPRSSASWSASATTRAAGSTTTPRTSCSRRSTISSSSTSTTSASTPSTSRTRS